eukprot:scaffold16113_cov65-Phaeocystis_antarctica.AAC.1
MGAGHGAGGESVRGGAASRHERRAGATVSMVNSCARKVRVRVRVRVRVEFGLGFAKGLGLGLGLGLGFAKGLGLGLGLGFAKGLGLGLGLKWVRVRVRVRVRSVSKKVARAPTMPKLCSIPRTPTLKVLAAQQDLAIFFAAAGLIGLLP